MQEPFHTLHNELLEPLTEDQCQQLDKALPKVDLDSLLGTLYEFIETFIRHIDMGKREWTWVSYNTSFTHAMHSVLLMGSWCSPFTESRHAHYCRLHPAVDGSPLHALLCRLLDTLVPHLEGNNLEVSPELEELPDDIILAQTVATWKYIVHFQAKQRQD